MKPHPPLPKKLKPLTPPDDLNRLTDLLERLVKVLEDTRGTPAMLEDVTLAHPYKVETVAMIAAACAGATAFDRNDMAIQALAAAESSASMGMEPRFIMRLINAGHPKESAIRQLREESKRRVEYRRRSEQVKEICRGAKRDPRTGNILLSSLVGLAYETTEISRSKSASSMDGSKHGNRLYNVWLREEAADEARGIACLEVSRRCNHPPIDLANYQMWTAEEYKLWEDLVPESMKAAVEVIRSRYETKTRPITIHDDLTASDLVERFIFFLEQRDRQESNALHAQEGEHKGEFVSPKTKGAKRGDDGKFEPAESGDPEPAGVYLPKRKSS